MNYEIVHRDIGCDTPVYKGYVTGPYSIIIIITIINIDHQGSVFTIFIIIDINIWTSVMAG